MQAGWQLAPTVVASERATPGLGLVVRYDRHSLSPS
jgi:hypothetical protein